MGVGVTTQEFDSDTLGVVETGEDASSLDECCCSGVGVAMETGKTGPGSLWCAELLCGDTKEIVFEPPCCVAFARNRRKFAASWAGSGFSSIIFEVI